MKTIQLTEEEIYSGTLLLVNSEYAYKETKFNSLIPADERFPDIFMKRTAAYALQLVFQRISAGNSIVPVSGYRSLKEQTAIYDSSLKENGEVFTRKYVALPNHSEHQTGLAIDLGLNREEIDFICPDFPYSGICNEFRKVAPNYGFIQRYAKEKESITGIAHEPWHFRYVGVPHAKIMEENGLSLEEYIALLKSFRNDCKFVYQQTAEVQVEIFYIAAKNGQTEFALPDHCIYQISGNNIDGFIVTVWGKNDDGSSALCGN